MELRCSGHQKEKKEEGLAYGDRWRAQEKDQEKGKFSWRLGSRHTQTQI